MDQRFPTGRNVTVEVVEQKSRKAGGDQWFLEMESFYLMMPTRMWHWRGEQRGMEGDL